MTISDLVYKGALAILWSAGHAPTTKERLAMRADSWRGSSAVSGCHPSDIHAASCELLRRHGYEPDETNAPDLALPEAGTRRSDAPVSGDLVRLTGPWSIVPAGTMMTICERDDGTFTIGRGGHYLNENGSVHLTAGGPSSIAGLPTSCLVRTGETSRNSFWRFQGSPEANGGVYFSRPVNVWEWSGDDADFTRSIPETEAA